MSTAPTILYNEKELFALMAKGDEAAFTKIFDYYQPRLYPFVLKMTRSEMVAEEIVQEFFIKVWTNREAATNIEHHRSYMFKMVVNRTISYMRSIARRARVAENAASESMLERNTTEEMVDLKNVEEIINEAVKLLPEQQKKVYILSRRQGLNAEEIAGLMNLSHKTVKNHLTEALRFIKGQLQDLPGSTLLLIVFLVKHSR